MKRQKSQNEFIRRIARTKMMFGWMSKENYLCDILVVGLDLDIHTKKMSQ